MQANPQQQPLLGTLPTTIEMALLPSTESRVITEPMEPFRILHVNEVWCHVCGYDAEEVIGETCAVLQGPGTCKATLTMLKQALNYKRNFAVQLLNYTKQGRPFMNTLQVTPLVDAQGQVTHYLGVVIARFLDGAGVPMEPSIGNLGKPGANERPQELGMKTADMGLHQNHSLSLSQFGDGGRYDPLSGGDPSSSGESRLSGLSGQTRRTALKPEPDAFGGRGMGDLLDPDDASSSASGRVPPFLTKLYEILTAESADIVAFNSGTASFTIHNPTTFAKEVLPRYFKHNKLGSFSQQLHTYGFRRRANASSLDNSIEFSHDQYTGPPAEFMKWIRAGGAISKRTVTTRDTESAPPHSLLNDMHDLDEGTRQLAMMFQQTRAVQAVQMRTILSKLTLRGLLSPESANYISSLPPNTTLLNSGGVGMPTGGGLNGMSYGGGGYGCGMGAGISRSSPLPGLGTMGASNLSMGSNGGNIFGASSSDLLLANLGASGTFGRISIGSQSFEGLQAQWDALDAGITDITPSTSFSANGSANGSVNSGKCKTGFNLCGDSNGSDSGDSGADSMQPFFEMAAAGAPAMAPRAADVTMHEVH